MCNCQAWEESLEWNIKVNLDHLSEPLAFFEETDHSCVSRPADHKALQSGRTLYMSWAVEINRKPPKIQAGSGPRRPCEERSDARSAETANSVTANRARCGW